MRLLILIFLSYFGVFAQAKPSPAKASRKPSQVVSAITLKVVYGDKMTTFIILKEKVGGKVAFTNSQSEQESKNISETDFEFIISKVKKLTGPTNDKSFCSRNYTELKMENQSFVGCMGGQNKLARDLQDIANLLTLLF